MMNADKTHCKRGHEFAPENTRRDKQNRRYCLTCDTLRRSDIQSRMAKITGVEREDLLRKKLDAYLAKAKSGKWIERADPEWVQADPQSPLHAYEGPDGHGTTVRYGMVTEGNALFVAVYCGNQSKSKIFQRLEWAKGFVESLHKEELGRLRRFAHE